MLLGLLDVLHGDEPDAVVVVVHHKQLLDAVLVQEPLRLIALDVLLHGDEIVFRHQLVDGLAGIGGEAHIAVGENADELALLAAAIVSTTGMPEIWWALIRVSASFSVASGEW